MKMIPKSEQTAHWSNEAAKHLKGRTVVECRYLTAEEAQAMDWYFRPVVIVFDDGTYIFPSADDEGNNGGSIFGGNFASQDRNFTLPVLR